jgi:hypothetical protein
LPITLRNSRNLAVRRNPGFARTVRIFVSNAGLTAVQMIMSNRAQWSCGAGTSNDQNLWMVLSEVT